MPHQKLRSIDLFSGIGGFSLALRDVANTIAYCDIEPECRRIIKCNIERGYLDDAPIFEDVCAFNINERKRPKLITAGFPCTDISIANINGCGLTGERSKLFYQVLRILDACPSVDYVFLENSHAILHRGLEDVLKQFADRGFNVSWCIINASDVGALHRRKRWYCFACRDGKRAPPKIPDAKIVFPQWKSKTEPCTRMLRKPKDKSVKESLIRRCKALGNSIVPQCAVYAWNLLVENVGRAHVKIEKPFVVPRKLKLVITDGKETFYKSAWATPCYSIWHVYSRITSSRAKTVLTVQMFFEQETIISEKEEKIRAYNKYICNPRFIEYLMGYPTDWTLSTSNTPCRSRASPEMPVV